MSQRKVSNPMTTLLEKKEFPEELAESNPRQQVPTFHECQPEQPELLRFQGEMVEKLGQQESFHQKRNLTSEGDHLSKLKDNHENG